MVTVCATDIIGGRQAVPIAVLSSRFFREPIAGKLTTKLAGVEPALGIQGARKKPVTLDPN